MSSDKRLDLLDKYDDLLEQIMEIDESFKRNTRHHLINKVALGCFNDCRIRLYNFWRLGK
tara:strand:- start:347 stop:526 length:180 start_codon:yes stop_codon:yes gene_type:complete